MSQCTEWLDKITSKFFVYLNFLHSILHLSTIHGFNHLADRKRHILEVLLWGTLVGMAIYGAYILSGLTLERYQQNPTVISMERDKFSWNTSFPSATICPTYKVNEKALDEYVRTSKSANKTLLREFLVALLEASYENFQNIPVYEEIASEYYLDLVLKLAFEFTPSVSNSGINGNRYSLVKIITEMGICYSYNSQLAVYNTPK